MSETPKNYVSHALSTVLSDLKLTPHVDRLEISVPDPKFGDYSTNVALMLAKKVSQSPRDVALKIVAEIKKFDVQNRFASVEEKGGFINFTLAPSVLMDTIALIMDQGALYGASIVGEGKKVIFEYSSPNTNKPLHIGHVRNDIYGQSCIRLLKSQGYQVVACEIINDRGIHIMKSVLMYMRNGKGKTPESEQLKPDHFVGKFYTMFATEAVKGEAQEKQLLEDAQNLLQRWEAGDAEVRKVWKQMNDWFFAGIQQTYGKEGTAFDEVDYESDIYDKGRDLVLEGVKKGIFAKEEDGSVSVDLTAEGLDKKYLLRKDGTTIYITQDLYLWNLRNERHHPDMAIVTTAAEQAYHFTVLGKLFRLLGFTWAEKFKHLPYEHVYLGKDKMSSRSGNTVSADELLTTVKEKVKIIMQQSERVKASAENEQLIETIAFGAIKYGYLKYEPNTRIYFDLDATISIEGNTGPYIQYAHARICSILRKAEKWGDAVLPLQPAPAELELAKKLQHYSESVQLAAEEYKPNLLANYLYELASLFSRFYQEVSVMQETDLQKKYFRLQLISATAQILSNGLYLLGIESPDQM